MPADLLSEVLISKDPTCPFRRRADCHGCHSTLLMIRHNSIARNSPQQFKGYLLSTEQPTLRRETLYSKFAYQTGLP